MPVDLSRFEDMGLEEVACPFCGMADVLAIPHPERFGTPRRAGVCIRCGLIRLSPRWSRSGYGAFYRMAYRELVGREDTAEQRFERQHVHGHRLLEFAGRWLTGESSVLEIGCSSGGILYAFRRATGCAVAGIEPNEEDVRWMADREIPCVAPGLEEADLAPASFTTVLCTQTLNHLLDPFHALREMRRLLRPDGVLLLEVQNFAAYLLRTAHPIQVDHVAYFHPEVLLSMVRAAGFDVVGLEIDNGADGLRMPRLLRAMVPTVHTRVLAVVAAAPSPALPVSFEPDGREIHRRTIELLRQRRRNWSLPARILRRLLRAAGVVDAG